MLHSFSLRAFSGLQRNSEMIRLVHPVPQVRRQRARDEGRLQSIEHLAIWRHIWAGVMEMNRVKEKPRNLIYCFSTLSKEKERIAFKNSNCSRPFV